MGINTTALSWSLVVVRVCFQRFPPFGGGSGEAAKLPSGITVNQIKTSV